MIIDNKVRQIFDTHEPLNLGADPEGNPILTVDITNKPQVREGWSYDPETEEFKDPNPTANMSVTALANNSILVGNKRQVTSLSGGRIVSALQERLSGDVLPIYDGRFGVDGVPLIPVNKVIFRGDILLTINVAGSDFVSLGESVDVSASELRLLGSTTFTLGPTAMSARVSLVSSSQLQIFVNSYGASSDTQHVISWELTTYPDAPTNLALYADLDDNNTVYGVKIVAEHDDPKSIKICDADESTVIDYGLLGCKYENGEFIPMINFAQVEDGVVTDIIARAENDTPRGRAASGLVRLETGSLVQVGWGYDGENFSSPKTLEEKVDELLTILKGGGK